MGSERPGGVRTTGEAGVFAAMALMVGMLVGCDISQSSANKDGGGTGGNDAGSGGADAGLSCEFVPCGGDLVGTWRMARACLTVPAGGVTFTSALCGPIPLVVTGARLEGTNTTSLQGGGASIVSASITATTVVSVPATCTASRVSCTAVAGELNTEYPSDTVSCSGAPATSGCVCEVARGPTATTVTGTFEAAGNEVVLTAAAGRAITYEYCVQGSTLRVRARDGFQTVTVYTR